MCDGACDDACEGNAARGGAAGCSALVSYDDNDVRTVDEDGKDARHVDGENLKGRCGDGRAHLLSYVPADHRRGRRRRVLAKLTPDRFAVATLV